MPERRAFVELFVDERGVEVPRGSLAVDEHRPRAQVPHDVGRRHEGERGDENVVAGPDTQHHEREVERGGTARQRGRRRHAEHLRELAFERVDVRTERRDPVGVERVEQQRALGCSDVGRRQEQAVHRTTVPFTPMRPGHR